MMKIQKTHFGKPASVLLLHEYLTHWTTTIYTNSRTAFACIIINLLRALPIVVL